jgi:glycerol-3-phosphate dehydrogenase (NAD(P)+)
VARGRKPEEIIRSTRSVVEGYKTTKAAFELTQKYEIRARLFQGMYMVLFQDYSPNELIAEMMKLPSKFDGE